MSLFCSSPPPLNLIKNFFFLVAVHLFYSSSLFATAPFCQISLFAFFFFFLLRELVIGWSFLTGLRNLIICNSPSLCTFVICMRFHCSTQSHVAPFFSAQSHYSHFPSSAQFHYLQFPFSYTIPLFAVSVFHAQSVRN